MIRQILLLALVLLLAPGCGTSPRTMLPTASIRLRAQPRPLEPARPSSPTPARLPTAPAPTPAPATPADQYQAWMAEARAQYPYGEPLETMHAVMLCESSGDPNAVNSSYYGLFQYQLSTWAGDWNPYRDQPILDARAQIFATAKAWADGNQHWWGCYPA